MIKKNPSQFNDTFLGDISLYPANRSTAANFNFLNNIRRGDTSVTPLQFVYEAADCRFFYTAEMLSNVSTIWTRVANMAFGTSLSAQQDWTNNPYCVRGSTGHRSSVSGGGSNNTDYAGSAPPASVKSQAQLPLLSDGTRMGWRLHLPTVANGTSTNANGSYTGRISAPSSSGSYTGTASPLPSFNSAAQRVAEEFYVTKTLAAGLLSLFLYSILA